MEMNEQRDDAATRLIAEKRFSAMALLRHSPMSSVGPKCAKKRTSELALWIRIAGEISKPPKSVLTDPASHIAE
jgi:hypothetical protein